MPYPAPTAPSADAAVHIRQLADALDARLAAGAVTVRKFIVSGTADSYGSLYVYGDQLSGMTKVTGAVFGPVAENTGGSADYNYVPAVSRIDNNNNTMTLKCYNAPDLVTNAGKYQAVVGLAWGPTAVAAQQPAPAPRVGPGDLFPRGLTPNAKIRYPGTDEPQYRTAEYIQDLAEDAGRAIGGAVQLGLVTWRDSAVQLNASGYAARTIPGLSLIRGAVLTPWDPGNFVRKSRVIAWIPPDRTGDGGATAGNVLRMRAYTNTVYTAGVTYPKPAYNDLLGVAGVIWGDP